MKLTKSLFKPLFTIVCFIALMVATSISAYAQKAGTYTLLYPTNTALPLTSTNVYIYGTTNYIGLPGTSTNLIIGVSEYDRGGLTWQYVNTAAGTNANVGIRIYKSMDGGVIFESSPTWIFTNTPAAPGSVTYTTVTNLSFAGATHLAFTTENNTAQHMTNVVLKLDLHPTKVLQRAATQ